MALKLARMARDDDPASDAVGSAASTSAPKARRDLDPLIKALARALDRQAPERTSGPESSRRS